MDAQLTTRHELSAGFVVSTSTPYKGEPNERPRSLYGNPTLRYTYNIDRHVALEGDVAASFNRGFYEFREDGRQVTAMAGLKAGFRKGRWGFFGTAGFGTVTFADAEVTSAGSHPVTHFGLRQGLAVEYSPSSRNFVRLDVGQMEIAEFMKTYRVTSSGGFIVIDAAPGTVPHHLVSTVTFGHRFGRLREMPSLEKSVSTKGYSVGGFYSQSIREHRFNNEVNATYGGGAWVEAPLKKYLSMDLVAMNHPKDDGIAGAQDGGTIFQAYVGPKVGVRVGGLGIYPKARPGIVRFRGPFGSWVCTDLATTF